jgi:hypothetical protein
MKKGYLLLISLCFYWISASAQTIKTAVLVIGNGNSAWAAGLQAATSGVKTVILTQTNQFELHDPGLNLHSGIEQEFLNRLKRQSGNLTTPTGLNTVVANELIKQWSDTVKNLDIIKNIRYLKVSRSGAGWVLKLSNGVTLKAKILVHAGGSELNSILNLPQSAAPFSTPLSYSNTTYRVSIASGFLTNNASGTGSFSTLTSLIPKEQSGVILANVEGPTMLVGQAAGAAAAYCAFFDKKTSEIRLKELQGELLKYRLNLMPFADVSSDDPQWKAMQVMGLMGVLKASIKTDKILFNPEQKVLFVEIEQPVKDLYYKAQIWFDDHQTVPITLENTISMICYVGNRSLQSTPAEIEKKWKTAYKFSTPFDLKQILTRRQFSVLINEYLQPLVVSVDGQGRIIR